MITKNLPEEHRLTEEQREYFLAAAQKIRHVLDVSYLRPTKRADAAAADALHGLGAFMALIDNLSLPKSKRRSKP